MPPHGHGVKDNEEDQSCSLIITRTSRYTFGCGGTFGGTLGILQMQIGFVRQACTQYRESPHFVISQFVIPAFS